MVRAIAGIICFMVALVACVPAQTPPQLDHTPGPAVRVSSDVYDAGLFRVGYPAGWRAITSPAEAPPFVIFAAPDNCALIVVASGPADLPQPANCPETDFRQETRTHGDPPLYVSGVALAARWDDFLPVFEAVLDTLEAAGETAE